MQFNLIEYLVQDCDNEAILIASREYNMYKINFTKVHGVDEANLVQPQIFTQTIFLINYLK